MLIRISDENEGAGEGNGIEVERASSQEYQTASELFDLMTQNCHFEDSNDDSLTTQDLVLLYKNIDVGTRLMSEATQVRRRKPNQHVETIVYNDEQESDSDLSENFSIENLHDVFKINQERLNLFENGSLDNILCHKLGGLEIKSSELSTDYNKQFLFKDPYIKEQLKGLNMMASCSEFESMLPTSLLDYICCKRLEDNYNFYMDNIIRYVQHTIDQLKRISNGDYLTDRAKEKWEEIKKKDSPDNTKVLATSTSIPLHVECKKRGNATWDDIVHSEVDVRSLSKILEKKIFVEIPKLICGSYRLFSKQCSDNLIISCKREKEDESRVDVVLQLQRSETGQVISNISSIMILQTSPAVPDLRSPEILPITYKTSKDDTVVATDESKDNIASVIEFIGVDEHVEQEKDTKAVIEEVVTEMFQDQENIESLNNESIIETNDYPFSDTECVVPYDITSNQYSSESSVALRDILIDKVGMFQVRNETTFNLISPDDLRVTMQRLNMRASLPEESGEDTSATASSKKKSPVRVRIKSPYENKSFILEEKKRKRLLEIREKREKKKVALGENAKVSKHKYGKGPVAPQPSSSVTKLSITNKSFYNSIYGESLNEGKSKTKSRKGLRKDTLVLEVPIEQIQEEYTESPNLTPDKNSKKYINRSYYLDDTETEVMYLEMKKDVKNTCSASTSAVSNEFSTNLNLLSQLIGPSETEISKEYIEEEEQNQSYDNDIYNNSKDAGCSNDITPLNMVVPDNSPKYNPCEQGDCEPKIAPATLECKKSIDKLYNLMKKLGKASNTDLRVSRSRINTKAAEKFDATTGDSTIQGSDSGTSLKHHLTSSNPSCFSFGKTNTDNSRSKIARKKEQSTTVVPKVIISSKFQAVKLETDKLKKDRRRGAVSPQWPKPIQESPLKAISQLLHEFDNVQKTRQKTIPENKPPKKTDMVSGDGKAMSRQNSFRRRSRLDQHTKENDQERKISSPRDKRFKPLSPMEISKIPHLSLQITSEDKHNNIDKVTKKKIADIIDEAKEARGEAVRGPSKLNSRLQSLAQPKRSYVQAHSEEYQHKYGKNLMADRLQRLATNPSSPQAAEPIIRNVVSPTFRNRVRRDATSSVSVKQPPPPVQPIDKHGRRRRSTSSSPNRHSPVAPSPPLQKQNDSNGPETIKKMVAVESYVKNHYGQSSSPLRNELLLGGQTSRVPLLPNDIELGSTTSSPAAEEANELGKKLHRIIDCMITTAPPLIECQEATPKISRENTDVSVDDLSKDQRTDSDYNIDILEDKNVETAVESHSASKRDDKEIEDIFASSETLNQQEVQSFNSTMELEKLENALYNQISGAFQKRLRMKNLTLTPKQSMQQVFLLQSGDAGSLLLKSTVSNLKMNKCDDHLHDLKTVPVLSNSHLNWNFAQIPMQIATVGYAFPRYQPDCGPILDLQTLNASRTTISEHEEQSVKKNCKSDKISQCFKGVHQEPKLEQAAQVSVREITTLPKVEETITEQTQPTEPPVDVKKSQPNNSDKKSATVENSDKQTPLATADNVDYTTSLDMLVGLLNEIQKITCQKPGKDESQCAELETILTNAAALEDDSPRDMVSITSLDKLRQLESNPSIYSYYISSEGTPSSECIISEPGESKPAFVDKEVSVNLNDKQFVNTVTDVPSLLPIAVNHSTNVTNSLIGVLSEPSSQSMISIKDYHTLYSNTFFSSQSIKKIVELPHVESTYKLKEPKKTDLNEKCPEIASPSVEIERISENKRSAVHKIKQCYVKEMHSDCAIKIKRDILVTMYSILVLTVFAALSIPDMALFEG